MTKVAVRRSDRFTGALFAILTQAIFFALLVLSRAPPPIPEKLSRELTLFLPRLRQPSPPAPAPARTGAPALTAPVPAVPFTPNPNAIAAPPDISHLGQSLFGCGPETYSSLTPEQRALCPRPGEGVAVQDAPNLMGTRSQVKDEAHWEAELARKKSPTWIPCSSVVPGTVVSFDPICLVAMASTGKLTNPRAWPIYETEKLTPEEFYKVEQAYDAWNKAHPDKAASAERVGVHPQ